MADVVFRISKDGQSIKVDAEGFTGDQCITKIGPIMAGLVGEYTAEKKPEYYRTTGSGVNVSG